VHGHPPLCPTLQRRHNSGSERLAGRCSEFRHGD
jgi:hypothetical protein